MADNIIKIIPTNPYTSISAEEAENIVEWLKIEIPAAQIEVQRTKIPQFVDCGGNLEQITCSVCGANISFDWWSEQMNTLYVESGFKTLLVQTLCCNKNVSLNELIYYFPCGFSCIEFDIYNPTETLKDSFLEKFKIKSGLEIRIVRSHI